MKVLFAMDLMENKAVRLLRGDFERKTEYSHDPLETVKDMIRLGARDFHIIDLDGARMGRRIHHNLIAEIRQVVEGYMEVGGGVRTEEDMDFYLKVGVDGIILGTVALEEEDFFDRPLSFKKTILGLDLLEGKAMSRGWKSVVNREIPSILKAAERAGVMAILCTSIARDGMLSGPDFDGLKRVMEMTSLPVIASGGVTSLNDLKQLKSMGVWATVVGKALYEGRIRIEEAMEYAD
ncbi:MAG: 1-(5-phosphoribosyl)-5-[(5-phosphoribosylamino)methylideneamino] imidazole-4-carboxamide isomerase [Syntrophorhabdaceae bacterium]|nr:1-(5-phosphoribosyl)-5-[(5-phosphoribosylamino)methylideneamino] imidazole-4-carboxamide isomerase [Syntrophorhabdaceae bacterium]